MDDISREPRAKTAPPPRSTVKGPIEVLDADARTVDEVALRREVVLAERRVSRVPPRSEPPEAEPAEAEPSPASAADSEPAADESAPPVTGADELARVLLALLLAQREATSITRLADACSATADEVSAGLERLAEILAAAGLPLELARTGDKVRILTVPAVYPYLQRLRGLKRSAQLSAAALETLAVIAYRQPVIRAEIEAIRGVKAGPMLRTLLEHKLVKVVGRADVPGRPLQYGTTQDFLERFGLSSLKELPSIQEFKSL